MWWLTVVVAAVPVEQALYVFELRGVPVGTVELSLEGDRYTYRSRQLFTRGEDRSQLLRSVELKLGEQREVPQSLWLWRRPAEGCVQGREELGGRVGDLCATVRTGARVSGTVFSESFEARYDERARLDQLTLGPSRFTRLLTEQQLPPPPELFGDGFPIDGKTGPLAIVPPLPRGASLSASTFDERRARALAARVHASFTGKKPLPADLSDEDLAAATGGNCVAHARRFLHLAPRAAIIYGVVAENDRAHPHAWVRLKLSSGRTLDLDPTSLAEVSARTHLPLAAEGQFGAVVLDLLGGRRRIVRTR